MGDLTFTITGTMIGGFLLWIAARYGERWFNEKLSEIKARREAFEAHIRECNEKKTHTALTDQRIKEIETQLLSGHNTFRWLGDCVVSIGAKLDVHLPERPRE